MEIKRAGRGKGAKFGARKYAACVSVTRDGVTYQVAKIRIEGSRNYGYVCTCPDHLYRQRACKHIAAFKAEEAQR